jgi:hypothetical protein
MMHFGRRVGSDYGTMSLQYREVPNLRSYHNVRVGVFFSQISQFKLKSRGVFPQTKLKNTKHSKRAKEIDLSKVRTQ